MVRVRSQSVQRMESQRESRMASLGPPGSNGGTRTLSYATSPTQANIAKWAGAFASARAWGGSPDRGNDERPRSASARFHRVLERLNWSPTIQVRPSFGPFVFVLGFRCREDPVTGSEAQEMGTMILE